MSTCSGLPVFFGTIDEQPPRRPPLWEVIACVVLAFIIVALAIAIYRRDFA